MNMVSKEKSWVVLVSNLESFFLLWRLSMNTTVHGCRNKDFHSLVRHTGWQVNAVKLKPHISKCNRISH